MAHIFARIGWPVAQLQGGYQSFRRHVHAELPQLATQVSWKVICGPTGSGKSALLKHWQHKVHRYSIWSNWPAIAAHCLVHYRVRCSHRKSSLKARYGCV
jgi:energy-coupling factor transporter ATP-binding protein EcfA2